MNQYTYDIVLDTPLGERYGQLQITITDNRIEGYLSLFGNKERVQGEIRKDSDCRLTGKLVTLISEIQFEASGQIDSRNIDLTLQTEKSKYQMTGHICRRQHNGSDAIYTNRKTK